MMVSARFSCDNDLLLDEIEDAMELLLDLAFSLECERGMELHLWLGQER